MKEQQKNQILIYEGNDGKSHIEVCFEGETVWLSQSQLADLFNTTKANISLHAKNIFNEGDGIIPNLLTQRNMKQTQAIFLYDSLESIKEKQTKRNRHGKGLDKADASALFSYTYGQELKQQAELQGFVTISASPMETLFERVLKVLGE